MRKVLRSRATAAAAFMLMSVGPLCLLTAGCSNYEKGHVVNQPMTQAEVDQRVKQIQADPHMPQFAKDAAIGQLRRGQTIGQESHKK